MQYHEACGMHRVHDTDTWHSVLCAMTMALVMEVERISSKSKIGNIVKQS